MTAYETDSVITLQAIFRDSTDTLFDPTIISITILASDQSTVIGSAITTGWTKVSTGIYTYNYTLPSTLQYPHIYHKWTFKDGNNVTDTKKQKIELIFNED